MSNIHYESILRFIRYTGKYPGYRIECDPNRYAMRLTEWVEERGQLYHSWVEAGYIGTTQVYQVCYLFKEDQSD